MEWRTLNRAAAVDAWYFNFVRAHDLFNSCTNVPDADVDACGLTRCVSIIHTTKRSFV